METLFLCISVLAGTAKSAYSKRLSPYTADVHGFGITNTCLSLTACAVILLSGITSLSGSLYTVGLGILFGICTAAAQYFYMQAFTCGAVSVVTFVYSCGFLLPTAAGTLFWHESVSVLLVCGVLLLLCAFFLCAKGKETDKSTAADGRGDYRYAFLAMLCSGIIGILQKIHQASPHKAETTVFLCTAFLISALLSFVLSRIPGTPNTAEPPKPLSVKNVIRIAAVSGIFIGAANAVNLRLSGMLPAAVCFPITNGGVIVCAAIVGRILFRERLTGTACAGIVLGLLSILIIGLAK